MKTENSLTLRNRDNDSVRTISEGKRISFRLKDDSHIHHGTISSINKDMVEMDGKKIPIRNFMMIHTHPMSLTISRLLGLVLLLCGSASLIYGLILISERHELLFIDNFMLAVIGAMLSVMGLAGDFLGVIPFLTHTRKYNLETDWMIDTNTL